MKRFWTDVAIDADRVVTLDGRPVRTPARVPLALPTDALAELVAAEWRAVPDRIDPRAMPLTSLANAAIDRIALDPAAFAAGLAAYGDSDLLYYRTESPDPLVARQVAAWDPWLDWARTRYDVHFETTAGIVHRAQPPATLARLAEAVTARDAFHLAGLSPVVTITGSLVLALALIERAGDVDTLWAAAHVDEAWQAELWGEDTLATQALANKRREFDAAAAFLFALEDGTI
jgi:chaperone required for assembly of F1-ATPase